MFDERPLDEKLAPQTFVDDFVWAARALVARPSVALISVGFWVLAFLVPVERGHMLPVLVWLAAWPMYLGWFGAERLFFLRRLEGTEVSLPALLRSARSYIGRFFRLAFCVGAVFTPIILLLTLPVVFAGSTTFGAAVARVSAIVAIVALDVVLTFVPAALVFTTKSARQALRIGWVMIRESWPRSALYVVCPPLALNMVNAIFAAHLRAVQLVTMPALALLALVAKGATVAFYLRERPMARAASASD
jgi:hypothetical protein